MATYVRPEPWIFDQVACLSGSINDHRVMKRDETDIYYCRICGVTNTRHPTVLPEITGRNPKSKTPKTGSLVPQAIIKRDGFKGCRYCGDATSHTIEHLTPKSRGGSNELDNKGISCMRCNNIKADATEAEFIQWMFRGKMPRGSLQRHAFESQAVLRLTMQAAFWHLLRHLEAEHVPLHRQLREELFDQ